MCEIDRHDLSVFSCIFFFICDAFKLKSDPIVPRFESKNEQDVWMGSFAGFVEGMAILIKQDNKVLYERLIDAMERVSLR